ncbi:MAG: methyltransferase domain-containing protein [Rhodospirillaceae bacterium]|nr:methyltransferase domain-containing protein [Rhodospirillaceae bacterium]
MTGRLLRAVTIIGALGLLSACEGADRLDLTAIGRDAWQRPGDVMAALEVGSGATVADVGAGHGYFVPHLAAAVGAQGRVLAVEVDAALAEALSARFAQQANVEVILGRVDDPLLPDGSVDLVLLVNVYHHIADRAAYFARLRADLSPRGRVAVIEPDADLGGLPGVFVPDGHASRVSDLRREMGAAGYRPVRSYDFLPVQIFEVFAPGAD